MSQKEKSITFDILINAPISHVFHFLTKGMKNWFVDDMEFGKHVGSRIFLYWDKNTFGSGKITQFEKDHIIAYSWHGYGEPYPTSVKAELASGNDKTSLKLEHKGFGHGPEWDDCYQSAQERWEKGIKNLVSVAETGKDQRIFNRPLIGIMVGEFTGDEGDDGDNCQTCCVRIASVIPGLSAELAGLQPDDFIYSFNGVKLSSKGALNDVILQHEAGDVIDVIYYHNGKKLNTPMKLSYLPVPEPQTTGIGLADLMNKLYQEKRASISDLVTGLDEFSLEFHPDPSSWNIKEILTHLSLSERENIDLIVATVNGVSKRDYSSMTPFRIKAYLTQYPSVEEILGDLTRTQKEVVSVLEELPESVCDIPNNMLTFDMGIYDGTHQHYNDHLRQISDNIELTQASR